MEFTLPVRSCVRLTKLKGGSFVQQVCSIVPFLFSLTRLQVVFKQVSKGAAV